MGVGLGLGLSLCKKLTCKAVRGSSELRGKGLHAMASGCEVVCAGARGAGLVLGRAHLFVLEEGDRAHEEAGLRQEVGVEDRDELRLDLVVHLRSTSGAEARLRAGLTGSSELAPGLSNSALIC